MCGEALLDILAFESRFFYFDAYCIDGCFAGFVILFASSGLFGAAQHSLAQIDVDDMCVGGALVSVAAAIAATYVLSAAYVVLAVSHHYAKIF